MTKEEVLEIVKQELSKAMENNAAGDGAPEDGKAAGEGGGVTVDAGKTAETVSKAGDAGEAKPGGLSPEEIRDMIQQEVTKAVEPVLKMNRLPSNLNGELEKGGGAPQEHYLHGIL